MSSDWSSQRHFDVNEISLQQLDTAELRHARWLYRKELRRAWWLGLGLTLAWWATGAVILGSAVLLPWAALEGARSLGDGFGLVAALLVFLAVCLAASRRDFNDWARRLQSNKDEVWAIVRTRWGTLRGIRRLLAARG